MANKALYKLYLKEIPQGKFEEVFRLDNDFFSERGGFELYGGNITIHLQGVRTREVYEVSFRLSGEVDTVCTRCENALRYPIEGEFHAVIKLGAEDGGDGDEEIVVSRDNPTLSLDDLFYSFVVLSIPLRRVHQDGECDKDIEAYLSQQSETVHPNSFEILLQDSRFEGED